MARGQTCSSFPTPLPMISVDEIQRPGTPLGTQAAPCTAAAWEGTLQRGLANLLRCQHPAGSFTDFWLPVGTSDAWVTAYTGLALHAVSTCQGLRAGLRTQADVAAHRAGTWLLTHQQQTGGWGYNAAVPADADSTAHALSLLARLGLPVPDQAVAFLRSHEVQGEGFRTYDWAGPQHSWTQPCPDVTAAALRALYDLGELTTLQLRAAWETALEGHQGATGLWSGYWWLHAAYPTGLALEIWEAAGCPPLRSPECVFPAPQRRRSAFELAWHLRAQHALGSTSAVRTAAELAAMQQADGGWPVQSILQVPPAHPTSGGVTLRAHDAKRVFTTASALHALSRCFQNGSNQAPARRRSARHVAAQATPHPLAAMVQQVALASGFPALQAQEAQALFQQLTRASLGAPDPWPSRQLTALSGGMPLEFSCTVGRQVGSALRYATEVSDPYLPPLARANSGLNRLRAAAGHLGYEGGWDRLWPALQLMTDSLKLAPDGTRFTIWGGVDQLAQDELAQVSGQSVPPAALKMYLNTLHRELGQGRTRLDAALRAANIPMPDSLKRALKLLDAAGFPQELGFALGPGGNIACKVYYELSGWRRPLVEQLLALSGLPGSYEQLIPEIPGLIREGLAAKSRAGIGLRLDPHSGEVTEVMTACAFPVPLLPLETTIERVDHWLVGHGDDPGPYRALARSLRGDWPDQTTDTRAMHSLFTRTLTRRSARTTIYLRPYGDALTARS